MFQCFGQYVVSTSRYCSVSVQYVRAATSSPSLLQATAQRSSVARPHDSCHTADTRQAPHRNIMGRAYLLPLALGLANSASGSIQFARSMGDHMVLQVMMMGNFIAGYLLLHTAPVCTTRSITDSLLTNAILAPCLPHTLSSAVLREPLRQHQYGATVGLLRTQSY